MHAYKLSRVDREKDMYLQAWINNQVKATNKDGKSVYKSFKDFYDYDKALKEIDQVKSNLSEQQKKMARIAKMINERG